jgi:localization factor PodJL
MKSGIPWSTKGVEPDAREDAKDSPARPGLTLGERINKTILEQAETPPLPSRPNHPNLKDRLQSITDELAMMAAGPASPTSRHGQDRQSSSYTSPDYGGLLERIENSERYFSEGIGSLNERLAALSAQLAKHAGIGPRAGDKESYTALEKAVRNIVGHIEVSERRTHDAVKSIQDQVANLKRPSGVEASEAAAGNQAGLAEIERVIGEFEARLAADREQEENRFGSLETQIAKMADWLQSLQGSAEALAESATTAAVHSVRMELGQIEQHIHSLASHTQASLTQSTSWRNEYAELKTDIEGLQRLLDDIRADVVSKRDLSSLKAAIEQTSIRAAQLPLAEMEHRLDEIGRRIADIEIRSRAEPQIGEIEQRVYELEARLASDAPAGFQDDLDGLHQKIDHIGHRLAEAEERLPAIATIERSMSELYRALENNRQDAHEIAEETATRVAQRFLEHVPQTQSAVSPELVALEEALAAVKEQSAQSDAQTQETLDAVHETLEEIVNKLAELEAGQRAVLEANRDSERRASFSAPANESPEPIHEPMEAPQSWQTAVQHHLAHEQLLAEPPAPHPASVRSDQDLHMDFFVQPEGAVEFNTSHSQGKTDAPADDDFIAAARRAAQAAAQGSRLSINRFAFTGAEAPRPTATKRRFGGFSLAFLRPAPALKPRHLRGVDDNIAAAADTAAFPQDQGRKRLIVAALLLLAAVSAYALSAIKSAPPIPPKAIQTEPRAEATSPDKHASFYIPGPKIVSSKASAQTTAEVASSAARHGEMLGTPNPLPAAIGGELLRERALAGRPEAQVAIAARYIEGELVGQNFSEAAKWYQKAALQGFAPAQYWLATLFEQGSGVRRDSSKAQVWYGEAAAQGHVKSMHNLGVLLAGAERPDYSRAARWFTEAAEFGLKDSQFNLALFYERGLGVKQDPVEAYFWYSAAANQGDREALAKAEAMGETLPVLLKTDALKRLSTWMPRQAKPEPNII